MTGRPLPPLRHQGLGEGQGSAHGSAIATRGTGFQGAETGQQKQQTQKLHQLRLLCLFRNPPKFAGSATPAGEGPGGNTRNNTRQRRGYIAVRVQLRIAHCLTETARLV